MEMMETVDRTCGANKSSANKHEETHALEALNKTTDSRENQKGQSLQHSGEYEFLSCNYNEQEEFMSLPL